MRPAIGRAALVAVFTAMLAVEACAHALPWRQGEARRAGYGTCAKGAFTSRVVWSASSPHRHAKGKGIVVMRAG